MKRANEEDPKTHGSTSRSTVPVTHNRHLRQIVGLRRRVASRRPTLVGESSRLSVCRSFGLNADSRGEQVVVDRETVSFEVVPSDGGVEGVGQSHF